VIDVRDHEATRQVVQRLFLEDAFEDFQDGIAATAPRTQEKYPRMTAGREMADIRKVQVESQEQPAFRNRPLPDHGIVCAAETFVRHALGGVAGPITRSLHAPAPGSHPT
jgi:hypothetical protein